MSPFRLFSPKDKGESGAAGAIYEFSAKRNNGTEEPLSAYRGKVLLIVNVASQCGFTPQYAGLEQLYRKYREQGFEILAFPSNQFGQQEPGTDAEIRNFCDSNYQVSFPLFSKIEVNGSGEHPLYTFLKKQKGGVVGNRIKWNFTKFLVDRQGRVAERFAPSKTPEEIAGAIEAQLKPTLTA